MGTKAYRFVDTCVTAGGPAVNAFDDSRREIGYRTFARYVDIPGVEAMLGYGRDIGLRLKNDWHVTYYRGIYRGRRCYVLMWSAVHHFFVEAA